MPNPSPRQGRSRASTNPARTTGSSPPLGSGGRPIEYGGNAPGISDPLTEPEWGGVLEDEWERAFTLLPFHLTTIDEYGGPVLPEATEPGSVMSTVATAIGPRGFGLTWRGPADLLIPVLHVTTLGVAGGLAVLDVRAAAIGVVAMVASHVAVATRQRKAP